MAKFYIYDLTLNSGGASLNKKEEVNSIAEGKKVIQNKNHRSSKIYILVEENSTNDYQKIHAIKSHLGYID